MSITIFNPKEVEVGDIGPMMESKVSNPDLRAFLRKKGKEDGNKSAIVVGDSENMGVGVGTWYPENSMKYPVPVVFDEVLVIVEGSMNLVVNGEKHHARVGELVHLKAGCKVIFGTDEPTRVVWITSPPTWVALQNAVESGKLKLPS